MIKGQTDNSQLLHHALKPFPSTPALMG